MQPRDLWSWLEWVVTSFSLQFPSTPGSLQEPLAHGRQLPRPGLLPWAAPGPGRSVPSMSQQPLDVSVLQSFSTDNNAHPTIDGSSAGICLQDREGSICHYQCSSHPPTWSCKAAITLIAVCTSSRSKFTVIYSTRAIIRDRNVLLQKKFNIYLNP